LFSLNLDLGQGTIQTHSYDFTTFVLEWRANAGFTGRKFQSGQGNWQRVFCCCVQGTPCGELRSMHPKLSSIFRTRNYFFPEILCILWGTRENLTLMGLLQLWLPFEMQSDESSSFHFTGSHSVLSRARLKRWSWVSRPNR